MECPARLLCPWVFSRQECWRELPCLSPGDLPNQEIKPGLLHFRWILYHLSYQGSPKCTRKCPKIDCWLIFHVQVSARFLLMTEKPNWRKFYFLKMPPLEVSKAVSVELEFFYNKVLQETCVTQSSTTRPRIFSQLKGLHMDSQVPERKGEVGIFKN